MNERTRAILMPVVLFVVTILAYLPAFRAGFIWDDDVFVTQNYDIRSVAALAHAWVSPQSSLQYYPLVDTLFWAEYQIWGLWAPGDHAVSILLHASNALLIWLILKRLRLPGAVLAAAFFALHPVQVETTAWIMESKTLLATLFYLLAFYCFIRFWNLDEAGPEKHHNWLYWVGILFFALSLVSKAVTATLPAAIR